MKVLRLLTCIEIFSSYHKVVNQFIPAFPRYETANKQKSRGTKTGKKKILAGRKGGGEETTHKILPQNSRMSVDRAALY